MSTDRDVTGIVRSWLEEGVTALPDRVLDAVLDQLPATPQRRARWPAWRLNTMTTPLRLAAAAAAIGVLAAAVGIVPRTSGPGALDQAASPSPAASPSAVSPGVLVTGTFAKVLPGDDDFSESNAADFGLQERGRGYMGETMTSDPRLSGTVTASDNADRFCDGVCSPDTLQADLLWGTFEIANADGTWVGTSVGTTDMAADGAGVTYYELSGTGAYDGMSAVLFETEEFPGPIFNLSGVMFPGELPPER